MKNIFKVLAITFAALIGFSMVSCGGNDIDLSPQKTLVSIAVTTEPTKTEYTIGDALDISGLVVTATYSDGSTAPVSVTAENISGFDSSSQGSKTLTVTYGGKTTTFNVNVKPAGVTLSSIAVTTEPTKTEYTIGDTLDITGLVVTATYSDGSTATVSVTAENISGFDSSSQGSKTLTVTYSGKTTTFNVNVEPAGVTLSSIAITTQPTKTTYTIGEALDISGMVVTATYSDGSTRTVSGNISVFNSSTAGSKTLTVTYNGKTATFNVTVSAASIPVTGVTLNSTTGSLNVGGTGTLTATVAPSDATNKNVTWNTSNSAIATVNNGVVTAAAVGTANITVTTEDGSKTATCTVTVSAAIAGDVYWTGSYLGSGVRFNNNASSFTSFGNQLVLNDFKDALDNFRFTGVNYEGTSIVGQPPFLFEYNKGYFASLTGPTSGKPDNVTLTLSGSGHLFMILPSQPSQINNAAGVNAITALEKGTIIIDGKTYYVYSTLNDSSTSDTVTYSPGGY